MLNGYQSGDPDRSIPISLPQTFLPRNTQMPVVTFELSLGDVLRLRYLTLYVPNFNGVRVFQQSIVPVTLGIPHFQVPPDDPVTAAQVASTATLMNSAYGSVYAGLFSGGFERADKITGSPIFVLSSSGVGAVSTDPRRKVDFDSPGQYTLVVVNNTAGLDFDVVLTGVFKLT